MLKICIFVHFFPFSDDISEPQHSETNTITVPSTFMKEQVWVKNKVYNNKNFLFPEANYRAYQDFSPLELFELFFDTEMFELFVTESQRYALQKGLSDPLISVGEMKCFVGILIVSGYSSAPGKRYFWDQYEDVRNNAIYNSMRRNRFEKIMQCLHLNDNTKLDPRDKFSKVRKMASLLKNRFMYHFQPVQKISHDESIIEYFGKHSCKQCIRNKPIRFGYKVWCLSSTDGYLINFDLYQGKTSESSCGLEKVVGKCGATVIHLLNELPIDKKHMPYEIYFDNLFSSYELVTYLKNENYLCTGTIRDNRLRKCPILSQNDMKKLPRGTYSSVTDTANGIHVCRWMDNSIVTMISTAHGNYPISQVKRFSNKEKKTITIACPNVVKQYNSNMGGTDQLNQDANRLRIGIRGKKWWWGIFTWMLDISITNAWNLSKSSGNSMTQIEFRRQIAIAYLKTYGSSPMSGGRPSAKYPRTKLNLQKDGLNHFIVPCNRRRCAGNDCQRHPSTKCEKCDVGLCIYCFKSFHT